MRNLINILSNVINEQKRYHFSPDVYTKINMIADELWSKRNKKYKGKELVDIIPFKLADGTDGLVKVIVNPRLPYIGYMGTRPKKSLDPADIFIEVNPKFYDTRKNLYLTLYHEMIHASDPTQSFKWKPSYELTYDEKKDEKYWGHPIEFFAITNEFLEGLVLEFERRKNNLRNPENIKYLDKSFNNILNYFAKGEKLSKLSLDILSRINDEHVSDTAISKVVADIQTQYPNVEFSKQTKDEKPYYLILIELIKKYNPKIWPRFLTMLFKVKDEIQEILNKKEGI
jgi:hypothetical protein